MATLSFDQLQRFLSAADEAAGAKGSSIRNRRDITRLFRSEVKQEGRLDAFLQDPKAFTREFLSLHPAQLKPRTKRRGVRGRKIPFQKEVWDKTEDVIARYLASLSLQVKNAKDLKRNLGARLKDDLDAPRVTEEAVSKVGEAAYNRLIEAFIDDNIDLYSKEVRPSTVAVAVESGGRVMETPTTRPSIMPGFLPGDDIAAKAAAISYRLLGTRDAETGEVIEELPTLPGYDTIQSSDRLSTIFLSDDEIIVATPGSQALRDWTGPNLALVKGAATGSARDTFERNPQVTATLETIDNLVAGYPGRRLWFVGHSKGAGVALSAYERFKAAPGRDARATVFSTPALYFRGVAPGYVDGDRVRNYVREGDRFAGDVLTEGASFQPGTFALEFPGGEADDPHNLDTMIRRDEEAKNRLAMQLGSTTAAEEGTEAEVAAELRAAGDPVAVAAPEPAPEEAGTTPDEPEAEAAEPTMAPPGEPEPVQPTRRLRGSRPDAPVEPAAAPDVPVAPEEPVAVPAADPAEPSGPTVQAPVERREVKAGAGEPRAGERAAAMLADVVDPRIQKAVNVVCHSRNIAFKPTLREFIENGGVDRSAAAVGARGMAGLSVLVANFGSLMELDGPIVEQDPVKAEELFAQVACLIEIYTSKAETRYPGEAFAELSAWLKKNLFPVGKSLDEMDDDQKLAQGLRGVVVRLDPSASREEALAEMAAMSGGAPTGGSGGADHASGATAADSAAEAAVEVAAEGPSMEPSVVEGKSADGATFDLSDFLDRSLLDHPPAMPQLVPGDEVGFFDFAAEESETSGGELGIAGAPPSRAPSGLAFFE